MHGSVQEARFDVPEEVREKVREALDRVFLSPVGLAEFLDVPVRTVYAWNHNGTGPRFVRAGKHVRYRRSDVESWLEARTETPRSA